MTSPRPVEKRRRQREIRRVIGRQPVASQSELVSCLRQAGIEATQASVSRDLRELGIVKAGGRYAHVARLRGPAPRQNQGMVRETELITRVDPVGANLVVVRTEIGAASRIAAEIDQHRRPEIVATLAGDDTIFIAVPSRAAQGRVLVQLRPPRSP